MEENQNQETAKQAEETPTFQENQGSGVSFPTVGQPRKSGGAKTFFVIGILILVGILGFVIYKSASKKSTDTVVEPTPFDNLSNQNQDTTTVSTPAPSITPTPSANKGNVKLQVQNGTGITGEAAYLQTQLKGLGYTDVKVGNASQTGATATTVTFSSTLDKTIVSEITQKLKVLYQDVTVKTSASSTFDVVIVTGLRKGQTPKPSATPVASSSATPTAIPTATP